MNIEVTIKVDALAAALDKLADAIKLTASVEKQAVIKARVDNGEITLPKDSQLVITKVERSIEYIPGDAMNPQPAAETEKPKRKRTAKAAESTQESAGEQEAAQPETVTTEPEKPAEEPQSAPELGGPQYADLQPVPTKEQIGAAGAKMLDENPNIMPQLLTLLSEYNVQAIMQLKDDQLPGFAAKLRALGAEV